MNTLDELRRIQSDLEAQIGASKRILQIKLEQRGEISDETYIYHIGRCAGLELALMYLTDVYEADLEADIDRVLA